MSVLSGPLRKSLEAAVKAARRAAEKGSRAALKALAVDEADKHAGMSAEQKNLRNRLRVHGRQLGDERDERRGTQSIDRIVSECAYEHWHRLLFARFLAENGLLIEPENNVAISLAECRELARGRRVDPLVLASSFAERMLPQIFRTGDPVLEVQLPPETRQELERLVEGLAPDVFTADDSLGWTYQFWQADRKDEVNESGVKIGAKELPAVTQLFTEDYMVLFLLHNTMGAWWTAKRKAEGKNAKLTGYEWTYLRLLDDGSPAAGAFEDWPRAAKNLTVLDPCMGSGHFLVFALPLLVGFRMEEEGLSREEAVDAVLLENLFGLEIDPRCTQIAAFNLALAAWRMVGYKALPQLNLACSGQAINARESDWIALAAGDVLAQRTMTLLYSLFQKAPVLGSLIEPLSVGTELFAAGFPAVQPLLEAALSGQLKGDDRYELAVAAKGIATATRLLARTFTLVATNVPYLGRSKQGDDLGQYCERHYPAAKADLATCFAARCIAFCDAGGTTALVTPQNWLFLGGYRRFRQVLLRDQSLSAVVKLGPAAFRDMNFWAATTALAVVSHRAPRDDTRFLGFDASAPRTPEQKGVLLRELPIAFVKQAPQLLNPDARIVLGELDHSSLLSSVASYGKGSTTGDSPHFHRCFWELPEIASGGVTPWLDSPDGNDPWSGRHLILLSGVDDPRLREENGCRIHGQEVWGRVGVALNKMNELQSFIYMGEVFDDNVGVIAPTDPALLPALVCYCESEDYARNIREVDQAVKVTAATLVKVPFDRVRWEAAAQEKYPRGLPPASSASPMQWLFAGHPVGARAPLQVAIARLLGNRWPRQTGSKFPDCPALGPDGLEKFEDDDGIVCLAALKGEAPAATRLRDLLAAAFSKEWSATKQAELLAQVGFAGSTLEDWLQDGFFEQHCELFHQRPFVWHVWDGIKKGGFSALVNYHKLAGPDGQGRRTLEALIYSYLGDWITQQRAEQKAGTEGADARVAAAEHLKGQLEKILEGAPPFDIFVRWKPLPEQAIGWEPDIKDGVRLNIRPFVAASLLKGGRTGAGILRAKPKGIKWEKDRGTEPERLKDDYPWFWSWDGKTEDFEGGRKFDGCRWNDLHYSKKAKNDARARSKPQRKGKVA
jgi:hypothetical protein